MSEQINSPNYVVCHCQHCDGHIEFDANQLTEENSIIPCPHCGLETKLFIPQQVTVPTGADPPAVRREGFFCSAGENQETKRESNPLVDQKVQPFTSAKKLNRPSIRQKAISGRERLREIGQVKNFLEEQDKASGFKSKSVVLTKAQCEMPIAQELVKLLVEIEKDGFVTEQGAQKLNEWLESNSNVEILAFHFLSEKVKRILSNGKLMTETEVGIEVALNLQIAIERVLPKQIREPILAKRRLVEEQLRNNMPASKEMVALIRQLGGNPPFGITRGEAYGLKEKLWHQPSDRQLSYIRGLGGNPSPDITREEAGQMIESLLHSVSATERQMEYIRSLGGNPRPGLSRAEAEELIPQLQTKQYQTLAQQQPPTQRQMMVLRFWNRTDLAQASKWEVEQWLTKFYDEDTRRRKAWELFKAKAGDDGSQHDPSFVPLGAGENYLKRVK